ncbi:MAG: Ubiquinone biosynthesis O-methyltransferase [Microgenomates bacterium OLB22]|nr:MAG: Ubiquinone biosynthesis O-methyltransferase [Microgenomates bacterium OLB22]
MKTVDPTKYDSAYFTKVMRSVDYTKKVTIKDFKPIHHHIADLIRLTPDDLIVDYGCGNGDLAFLLAMKYGCHVVGIDYSKDAIDIANKYRAYLAKTKSLDLEKTEFYCYDITHTPKKFHRDVSAVYLADVIEHLYDSEIEVLMRLINKWSNKDIQLIIHTDNNAYLTYIRPLIDVLSILTGASSLSTIQQRNIWEKERHVNLTTPIELRKKMRELGFVQVKMTYSLVDKATIAAQIGGLARIPGITACLYLCANIFSFLLPSFYSVFRKNEP